MRRINLLFAAVAAAGMMTLGHAGTAEAVTGKVQYVYGLPGLGYGYVMVQYPLSTSWYGGTAPSVCYYLTYDQTVLTQAASYLAGNVTVYAYGTSESSCPSSPSAGSVYYGGTLDCYSGGYYFFGMRNN